MAVLLDSSFIIACFNKEDRHHTRALEMYRELRSQRYGKLIVLDHVFDELVTCLRTRARDKRSALVAGNALLNDPLVSVSGSGQRLFALAWQLFARYDRLSFTDALIAAHAQAVGIKQVVSFDNDFDGIPFIERMC